MKFKIIITIIYIVFLVNVVKYGFADVMAKGGQQLTYQGDFTSALELNELAILLNRNEPDYYRQNAKTLIGATAVTSANNQQTLKKRAHTNLQHAYNLNPNNLVTIRDSIALYYFLAIKDISLPAENQNIDNEYLPIAKNFYIENQKKYKDDAGVLTLIAKYQNKLNLNEDYEVTISQIKMLRPDVLEWHPNLVSN